MREPQQILIGLSGDGAGGTVLGQRAILYLRLVVPLAVSAFTLIPRLNIGIQFHLLRLNIKAATVTGRRVSQFCAST